MNIIYPERKSQWFHFQKILFRFIFIYFALYIAPFTWFAELPLLDNIAEYWFSLTGLLVHLGNNTIFHVKEVLVPLSGSGDTSFAWAQLCTYLLLSVIVSLVWTALDSKRTNYNALRYWLCLFTRYNLAYYCLLYGITKLFFQQMAIPGYSQLSTPLGDFSSQRLLWMFMGYSKPYQFFTGAVEVMAGLLLLFRKTSALGTIIATGVFINVVLLNLCYNIPVKLLSIHLLLMCLFLLANDYKRYLSFFISNAATPSGNFYNVVFGSKWMRSCRLALKFTLTILFAVVPVYNEYKYYTEADESIAIKPVVPGIYDVLFFSEKKDSLPSLVSDSGRWSEIAFDINGTGSIDKVDSNFLVKYNRSYFYYETDTINHVIQFKKTSGDTNSIASFNYKEIENKRIKLWGLFKADTLHIEIAPSSRKFQLTKEVFQWLSETSH